MKLNEYILKSAQQAGICKEWAERIAASGSVDDLLQMYVDGIDFCMEKDFPSRGDLVNLAADRMAGYGVCVDKVGLALKNPKFTVMLGDCDAHLDFNTYSVGQVYIRHTSIAEVSASDNSFVVIDCFDNAQVKVSACENAKVLVNVYGEAKVKTNSVNGGVIKLVNKHKSTY